MYVLFVYCFIYLPDYQCPGIPVPYAVDRGYLLIYTCWLEWFGKWCRFSLHTWLNLTMAIIAHHIAKATKSHFASLQWQAWSLPHLLADIHKGMAPIPVQFEYVSLGPMVQTDRQTGSQTQGAPPGWFSVTAARWQISLSPLLTTDFPFCATAITLGIIYGQPRPSPPRSLSALAKRMDYRHTFSYCC